MINLKQFYEKYWDVVVFPTLLFILFFVLKFANIGTGSILELFGILFSMIGMVLIKRELAIGQLVSMAGQFFLVFYFLPMELYGQMAFGAVWIIINLISFITWPKNPIESTKSLKPTNIKSGWMFLITIGLIIIAVLRSKSGIVGMLDWIIVYLGIIGQALMIRKKVQGWAIWNCFSVASIILFWMTGSYLLFVRTVFYLYTGITAYVDWHKKAAKNKR